MKRRLEAIQRAVELRIWTWRIVWRQANGRWFIFRDAPLWVVIKFLDCPVEDLGEQASDEMMSRLRKLERDLKDSITLLAQLKPEVTA